MSSVSLPGARRTLLGVTIMAMVVLVQLAASYVSNRDASRFVSVLIFLCVELPLVMLALSALFGWTRRTGRGWLWLVGLGSLIAGFIGASAGGLFFAVTEAWPGLELRLNVFGASTAIRAVVFGFIQAESHLGLWTLAFVLPFTLEDARVRAA